MESNQVGTKVWQEINKDNPTVNFLNQLLDIMVFIFKLQTQEIEVIEKSYSYWSKILLFKVNGINQLEHICGWRIETFLIA